MKKKFLTQLFTMIVAFTAIAFGATSAMAITASSDEMPIIKMTKSGDSDTTLTAIMHPKIAAATGASAITLTSDQYLTAPLPGIVSSCVTYTEGQAVLVSSYFMEAHEIIARASITLIEKRHLIGQSDMPGTMGKQLYVLVAKGSAIQDLSSVKMVAGQFAKPPTEHQPAVFSRIC